MFSLRLSGLFQLTFERPPLSELPPTKRHRPVPLRFDPSRAPTIQAAVAMRVSLYEHVAAGCTMEAPTHTGSKHCVSLFFVANRHPTSLRSRLHEPISF